MTNHITTNPTCDGCRQPHDHLRIIYVRDDQRPTLLCPNCDRSFDILPFWAIGALLANVFDGDSMEVVNA